MKRRVLAMLTAAALCAACITDMSFVSRAEEQDGHISFSELMTEKALVGYTEYSTMGVYYLDGCSIINKISSTKVGAGGVTNATQKCRVSINVILEQLTDSGNWVREASWSATEEDAFSVMVSKSKVVERGYYYRVRCVHYAATDRSSSCTDNLRM